MKEQQIPKELWKSPTEEQRKLPVSDAQRSMGIAISKRHVKLAANCRKDGRKCVVAQACRDLPTVIDVYIGATRSFLIFGTTITRYTTPTVLRDALNRWDVGGDWGLAEGYYELKAITRSQTREYFSDPTKKYSRRKRVGLATHKQTTPNPRRLFAVK